MKTDTSEKGLDRPSPRVTLRCDRSDGYLPLIAPQGFGGAPSRSGGRGEGNS